MDFAVGLNGWFQLSDGNRSVWIVVDQASVSGGLRPGICKSRDKADPREVAPGPKLKFDAFASVTVDLHLRPGTSLTVRERTEAASLALEQFREATVAASDAIRSNYQALYRSAAVGSNEGIRQALDSDALRATDLPSPVAQRLRKRLESQFESFGFRSGDDANAFFNNADIANRRAKLTIQFRLEQRGKVSGYSMEFSGPFTPRG
ncbi:MAG: hypothetical protein AB7T05_11200 [Fimbriimonadaceae bacterium]